MNKRKILTITLIVIVLISVISLILVKKSSSIKPSNDLKTNENELIENEIQNQEKAVKYVSPKGYELEYVVEKFALTADGDKDKFVYVKDENEVEKDEMYFAVKILENENNAEIKNNLIASSETTGDCKITQANLEGIYTEKENGNMVLQNLIFEIDESKMVIIEISKEREENDYIKNMIKTFKIN